jgi:hypothetical protein
VRGVDAHSSDRDDPVVAAARGGDEAAFTRLVERHRRELRVHRYRMVGSVDEAEDLVQETFLRAWGHIGGFEGRSTLRAWLYRLAAVADLLAEDVRAAMPPWTLWLAGRPAVMAALIESWDPRSPDHVGRFRMLATRANGQPAVAAYPRAPGDGAPVHRAFAIAVLRIEDVRIADMVAFHEPALFPAFGLPDTVPAALPADAG